MCSNPSRRLVVENSLQVAASQRLAGRDPVASDPIETRELVTGDREQETGEQAAFEETASSVATSLGVTVAVVAAIRDVEESTIGGDDDFCGGIRCMITFGKGG